jgi:hypothetical protein
VRQAERILQREITLRLQFAPLDALVVPSPNGIFLPTRSPAERDLVRRIVYRLKQDGALCPGAPDLVFLWDTGCGCMELKRPAEKNLLGRQSAGQLSDDQKRFRDRCQRFCINYEVVMSWPQARDLLKTWGRLPMDWRDADQRAGRAA